MRLLFIGDVHMADKSPSKRDENYTEDIFRKLEEIGDVARQYKVDALLFAGDIFHHKPPRETTHRTVQRLFSLFESYGVPVYICVGNHDITEYRLDSLEKQPLGVLAKAKNVTLLQGPPGQPLMTQDVALHSIPGVRGIVTEDYRFNTMVTAKWNVLVSHQSIVPDKSKLIPQLREKDFMHDSQEVANVCGCDVILYGHEHGNHGVYKRKNPLGKDVLFVNLGAISRGSLTESDLSRHPSVFVLDLGDKVAGKIVALKNVRPIEECYLLEEHFQSVEHKRDVEDAVASLKDTRLEKFSVEGVYSDVEIRDDITEDVREATLELLETVR